MPKVNVLNMSGDQVEERNERRYIRVEVNEHVVYEVVKSTCQ